MTVTHKTNFTLSGQPFQAVHREAIPNVLWGYFFWGEVGDLWIGETYCQAI